MIQEQSKKRFHVILVKPSKYDDDGYVIRWWRGIITSNSLACLYSLTQDVAQKQSLGPDVELITHCFDETVQVIPLKKISRELKKTGERAVVCMAGVQTNQYPRAVDLSLEFMREGIPAMIGGFHVSGVLEMLPDKPPEIVEALDLGITLVAGEVENRWVELMQAAYENRLEKLYNFVGDKPALQGVPGPILRDDIIHHFLNDQTSFDAGRGCPFHCSFCTIINVQGNTMRGRSADDIEKLIRHNLAHKTNSMFITDDNFARHKDWEQIADRIIDLKENQGLRCSLMIQTDTVAHKIPNFIEKMAHMGVRRVFIGMESVNPDNLRATGKYQNQLSEYRKMLQKWRDNGVITIAGYIIGFPGDTYESIMKDIDFLKNEIPLDVAEFFVMTPLPGSVDHQKLYLEKVPMDADMNRYDTARVCKEHPLMSREELERAYLDAWKSFYSKEHMRTLLLRRKGPRRRLLFAQLAWFSSSMFLSKVHPLLAGFYRIKRRGDRRRGLPRENPIVFFSKLVWDNIVYTVRLAKLMFMIWRLVCEANREENLSYMDDAITPVKEVPVLQKAQ